MMLCRSPRVGVSREHLRVGVHHPIDGAIADRVSADVHAGLMEQAHHLAIDLGVGRRIAEIAVSISVEFLFHSLRHPGGARAAAAVHEDLRAAGQEPAVAERLRRLGRASNRGERRARRFQRAARVPQHADMLRQLVLAQQLAIRIPDRLADGRILDRGHAFAMQILDALQDSCALLLRRRRRDQIQAPRPWPIPSAPRWACRSASRSMVPAGGSWRGGGDVRQPQRLPNWPRHSDRSCASATPDCCGEIRSRSAAARSAARPACPRPIHRPAAIRPA